MNNLQEDNYLALSHALRIPLAEILGLAELLSVGPLSPTQYQQVVLIRQAGDKLLNQISHLLKTQQDN